MGGDGWQRRRVPHSQLINPTRPSCLQALEEMIGNAENFYQALGFPYRCVHVHANVVGLGQPVSQPKR